MEPDELGPGDAGELGGVFDTITGTVRSIEGFGDAVGEVTSFSMTAAMIWAVILFMFFTLLARLARPWSEGAAERYRTDRRVFTLTGGASRGLHRDPRDARIEDLEDRLAAALAQIRELTDGATAPKEVENVA